MKFQRRFYNDSVDFKKLTVQRIVIGILLGLLSTFIIYSFFYVLRETYRAISLGFMNYGFWSFQNGEYILSEEDRSFYNIFFSGLSLIFGNSIAILFVFCKPNKILNRLDPRRKRLLNDQVFLSFNFSYWFTKVGLVFGVFSMCCMDFEFLPYFKPFIYLLLTVLYLETWKNLASVIKKKRLKIQIIHFLVMLCLTIGLSKIDVVNYKAVDQAYLVNNPIIDFPKSEFYHEKDFFRRDRRLALKLKLNDEGELDIFTEDRNKIDLGDVKDFIKVEKASFREELIPFLSVSILADKHLNVEFIKMVEAELYLAGIRQVNYEIYTKNLNGGIYFENDIIKRKINKSVLDFKNIGVKKDSTFRIILSPLPPPLPEANYALRDTIMISIKKKIKFNDMPISPEIMIDEFKRNINSKTLFLYHINKSITYQDYIVVLSAHNKATNELREQKQTVFSEYDEHYWDEQYRLKEKYPIIISERLD